MRTSIINTDDGITQIVLTPENDMEERALSFLKSDIDIELLITDGTMFDREERPFTANVDKCRGNYLRIYKDEKSKILVLKPKKKT
jgi:hypothetical protein